MDDDDDDNDDDDGMKFANFSGESALSCSKMRASTLSLSSSVFRFVKLSNAG